MYYLKTTARFWHVINNVDKSYEKTKYDFGDWNQKDKSQTTQMIALQTFSTVLKICYATFKMCKIKIKKKGNYINYINYNSWQNLIYFDK